MKVARRFASVSQTILCFALIGIAAADAADRPNILLIVSEDYFCAPKAIGP